MPIFSQSSKDKLSTCHPDLQRLMHEAIQVVDFRVTCGHRNQVDQNQAVVEGKSKARWPTSKHNVVPSLAVDLVPCPVDWKDRERFILLAGIVIGIAWKLGIPVRWGGDWDGDSNIAEHSFQDLPHFELIGEGGK